MAANGPTRLRDDGVFILNPFTLIVNVTDEVVIDTPVTAVVLFDGVPPTTPMVVEPIVAGRTITVTMPTTQLALLPKKKATLNILFNGIYVIQQPLTPTTDGSVPATVTYTYSDNTLGVYRVSFYHGVTQAALTEADRIACDAARDYIDDAMVQISDRVPGFLDDLSSVIMAGHDANYTSVAGGPTGGLSASSGVNGATVDTVNRIFTIDPGTSGANSYMRRPFDLLSTENLRINDKINLRCLVSQSVDGAISDSVIGIRLFTSTGVAVPLTTVAPAVYDAVTRTFKFDGQFTVTNTATTYYIELYIKSGAPNQPVSVALRWLDVGLNQDKYLYEDAIQRIDTAVRGYASIAVTFDDQPVVTQIDLSGVTDVTTALQDEINKAIATSGRWLGRAGTPRITSSITLGGRIEMLCNGMDLNANIPILAPTAGAEAFTIFTSLPVAIRNLVIRRAAANVAQQPTPFRFSASFINKNSVFERVEVYNMPRGFTVDYCDNLKMIECIAGGGQFYGLRAGANAPLSLTNLYLLRNIFEAYLDNHAQIYNAEGLLVEQNIFRSGSPTTIPLRSLELIPSGTGIQKGAKLRSNQFLAFREYGLSVAPVTAVTLKDVTVFNNYFDDRTPDSTDASSRPMNFAGVAQNIDFLDVFHNHVYCKEIGLRIDNAKRTQIKNNTFDKSNIGGAYPASQGILGSNLLYAIGGNIVDPALAVATVPGGWASSTAYTTV